MEEALDYTIKSGITTEDAYPYTGKDGSCKSVTSKKYKFTNCYSVPKTPEDLKAAVDKQPISVAVYAEQLNFMFYTGGIADATKKATFKKLDHGVLIVGYGTEKGKDYWITKNSWGGSWGEQGYIRMNRAKDLDFGAHLEANFATAN